MSYSLSWVNPRQAAATLPLFSFVGARDIRARPLRPASPLEYADPKNVKSCTILVQINPLDSALTDRAPLSPLEYALTKKGGRGSHLNRIGSLRHSLGTLFRQRGLRSAARLTLEERFQSVIRINCWRVIQH